MKRVLSALLAVLVLISVLTTTIFADFGGGSSRGSGAGRRLETARKYYTSTSDDSSSTYNTGNTDLYSIVDSSANTLNFLDYTVTYNNYEYNEVNNTFTFYTDNSVTYNITENVTYVTIVYPVTVEQEISYETATLYYELPDGRNSYDLTADDVWGVYFNYNAVNYQQVVEDDGVTLGLWHFDENYADSSANQFGAITSTLYNFVETPFGSGAVFNGNYRFYYPTFYPDGDFTFEQRVYVSSSVRTTINGSSTSTVSSVYFPILSNYCISGFPTDSWVWVSFTVSSGKVYIFMNGQPCYVYNTSTHERLKNGDTLSNSSYQFPIYGYTWNSYAATTCYYGDVIFDEARLSNAAIYTEAYTPSSQPFDTNLVFVVPDEGEQGDIAVKSNVAVSGLRVGGVRPTYPPNGYVYVYIEDDVCQDVQQYQTDGWYSVDATVYVDGEWVTAKGYDMSSFVSYDPDTGGETDGETDGETGGETGGDTGGETGGETGEDEEEGGILGMLENLLSSIVNGIVSILETVLGGVISLLVSLVDQLVTGITTVITGLVDSMGQIASFGGTFKDFLGQVFPFIPSEIVMLLGFSLSLSIILMIIKFFRG